jgi:hypothetical protein
MGYGIPHQQIAQRERMSFPSIHKRKKRLDAFGTVDPNPLSVQGRPRSTTIDHEEAIADFIHDCLGRHSGCVYLHNA